MKRVQYNVLKEKVIIMLCNAGVCIEHASIVADVLVYADASGITSHGTVRLEHYLRRIAKGGINTQSKFAVRQSAYPWSRLVDAQGGLGHVAALHAVREGIDVAKTQGIAVVSVVNTSHCGALSYYVRQITSHNFIGFVALNSDKYVVPSGGTKPFLGTNPIAWGFPQVDADNPVIVDLATSASALGKIITAREKGESIPRNCAVDAQGIGTENPDEVAALLPLAGHKGYALACVVEILSAIFTGSAFGPHLNPMYEKLNAMRNLSAFFLILDTGVHVSQNIFAAHLTRMIDELHAQPHAKNSECIRMPGEMGRKKYKQALKDGVPILECVHAYLGL